MDEKVSYCNVWCVNGYVETSVGRQLENIDIHLLKAYNLTTLRLVLDC